MESGNPTESDVYADRLVRLGDAGWKRLLNVQAPYRWNLRRLDLGRTLDVGCGTGRNLANLADGSVGVDHNAKSVRIARDRGLTAFTSEEFLETPADSARFDSLLLAHVAEHLTFDGAVLLIKEYRPYLRPGAVLALICPQEAGYRSDSTHVTFFDVDLMRQLCAAVEAPAHRAFSFPFPRPVGKVFRYNEFVVLGRFSS